MDELLDSGIKLAYPPESGLLTCICLTARYFVWPWSTHKFVTSRCGRDRGTKKTNAIRCGVLNVHRATSMADTDTDAVRKQKKAEYDKQYRLKRKLLLQQQASKDIYMYRYFHP
jgi:hypothetical protein